MLVLKNPLHMSVELLIIRIYGFIFSIAIDEELLTIRNKISSGTFGSVYHGTYNGKPVAVKEIWYSDRVYGDHLRFLRNVHREIDALQICSDQPSVTKLIGATYESFAKVMIVLDKYDCTLRDYLESEKRDRFTRVNIASQCVDLLELLAYRLQFIHGDIKSNNLLIKLPTGDEKYPKVVLADLGTVGNLNEGDIFYPHDRPLRNWSPRHYHFFFFFFFFFFLLRPSLPCPLMVFPHHRRSRVSHSRTIDLVWCPTNFIPADGLSRRFSS